MVDTECVNDMIALFHEYSDYFGITDYEFPDVGPEDKQIEFEDKFRDLICLYRGHRVIQDGSLTEEHDFCLECGRLEAEIGRRVY